MLLCSIEIGNAYSSLFSSLKNNSYLKKLDISNNGILHDGIKSLCLGLTENIDSGFSSYVYNVFSSNNTSNAYANKSVIESLNLSYNILTNESAEYISDLFTKKKSLLNIQLNDCGLSNYGISVISKTSKSIQSLDFSLNKITENGLEIVGKYYLDNTNTSKFMQRETKELYLSMKILTFKSDLNCVSFLKYLSTGNLCKISLSNNSIADTGFILLIKSIIDSVSLSSVNFSLNNITTEGIKSLVLFMQAESFNKCGLTDLKLSNNYVNDEGFELLSKTKINKNLSVDLTYNKIKALFQYVIDFNENTKTLYSIKLI